MIGNQRRRAVRRECPHSKAPYRVERRRRRGVATLWLILFLPVFLVALCVVVDVGTIWLARAELEDGLEAAAIAGVVVWNTTANAANADLAAINLAAANAVQGVAITLVAGEIDAGGVPANQTNGFVVQDPVAGGNNPAVRVIASRTIPSRAIPGVNYTVQASVIAVARNGNYYLLPSP
jgi:Flp pilus assembly protein TadG